MVTPATQKVDAEGLKIQDLSGAWATYQDPISKKLNQSLGHSSAVESLPSMFNCQCHKDISQIHLAITH